MISHTHRTLVFFDLTYPRLCSESSLSQLITGPFALADAGRLAEELKGDWTLLISFHGPYFPKSAWPALLAFLEQGGNLAIFGGMPFAHPVNERGELEPEQDAYTRQIFLGPFFPVTSETNDLTLEADADALLLRNCPLTLPNGNAGSFWACYPKLTQAEDHPEDLGSAGPFDTVLQPLIYAQARSAMGKRRVSTPAFLLDQRSGRFKGGRWLLSAWQPATEEGWLANAQALRRLIALAAEGVSSVEVRPALGCYRPGEAPSLIVTTRARQGVRVNLTLSLAEQNGALQTYELTFEAASRQQEALLHLPQLTQPGLYRVTVEYQSAGGEPLGLQSGFWVWDERLAEATRGQRLTAGRDFFYQGQRLFFIYGTTYMDSRVQRKFLHLPNPARWDREMAEMKAAGINLIRTGIWTAWRELTPLAGVANEGFLRALDAFVMTACKHGLQVIFTFFSFFPPLFEGENPWLDPRSVEAQEDFVALLARRYAQVELLSWDLINEPSFGDPKKIFASRPLPHSDRFEIAAFQRWLAQRYSLSELQLRWRQTPADLPSWERILPPRVEDFETSVRNTQVLASLKVADYTRFSQEMFLEWATRMREAIRAAGGRTLVGVGQDEAGARLSPQFYASAVDYTTTHPWWNIDDLLWDMLLDKTLEKPNLIQEIGVMLARDIDGRPWRSEQVSAALLERKLVTGLIARGAGLIQWLWHTNGYMTSDNENSIGLLRVDNSAKPELAVIEEFARLIAALDGLFLEAPTTPDVWVVIPYAQWFARPLSARDGTRQAARALGYDLGVIPQMIGEHQLGALATGQHHPRALILPAAQLLEQSAWQQLLRYVHAGGTLLVNGVIGRDTHNLPFDPGITGATEQIAPAPVARYENLEGLSGHTTWVTFAEEKISYVKKAHNRVMRFQHGAGTLIWCGQPLELANEQTALSALYRSVLPQTQKQQPWRNSSILLIRQALRDGTLVLLVSEAGRAQEIALDEGLRVLLEPERAGALILRTGQKPQLFGGIRLL